MAKWAKYAIIAVKYDKNDTHIIEVQRYECDKKENKLIKKEVRSRSAIIKAIEEKGLTYTTATKTEDGYWEVGKEVHVTTVGGKKYLRTDSNKTTKDNLGKLPEF